MLASITPLGERARGQSWRRAVIAHVAASTGAAAALGAALGAVGTWLPGAPAAPVTAGVLATVATVADLRGRPPSWQRQVDERWLARYRDWVHGAGFGAQLGLGVVTIVTSASVYLTWVLALLAGPAGAAVGAVFGAARGLPLVTLRHVDTAGQLRAHARRWQRRGRAASHVTVATMATASLLLLTAGWP